MWIFVFICRNQVKTKRFAGDCKSSRPQRNWHELSTRPELGVGVGNGVGGDWVLGCGWGWGHSPRSGWVGVQFLAQHFTSTHMANPNPQPRIASGGIAKGNPFCGLFWGRVGARHTPSWKLDAGCWVERVCNVPTSGDGSSLQTHPHIDIHSYSPRTQNPSKIYS